MRPVVRMLIPLMLAAVLGLLIAPSIVARVLPPPPPPQPALHPGYVALQGDLTDLRLKVDGVLQILPEDGTLRLPAGRYHLGLSRDGYAPREVWVDVASDATTSCPVDLTPHNGSLAIAGPAGADVLVDGKPRGHLPLRLAALPPRRYQITVRRRGYEDSNQVVAIAPGRQSTLQITLLPMARRPNLVFATPTPVPTSTPAPARHVMFRLWTRDPPDVTPLAGPEDTAIVPGERIGRYTLGDVAARWTDLRTLPENPEALAVPGSNIIVYTTLGRIMAIGTVDPDYRTPNGIGLGATSDAVLQAFGTSDADSAQDFLVYRSLGISFTMENGRVVGIAVGAPIKPAEEPSTSPTS